MVTLVSLVQGQLVSEYWGLVSLALSVSAVVAVQLVDSQVHQLADGYVQQQAGGQVQQLGFQKSLCQGMDRATEV